MAATDALLVAAGRGDLDAFAAFYDATAPRIVGLLHGVLGRPERAESLTEEVYLAAWRDAPTFDPRVRSAEATLVRFVRRALIAPVRQRLASTDTPRSERAEPVHRTPLDDPRQDAS